MFFFYPIGDDVDSRNLPFVGITIILLNLVVIAYEYRLIIDENKNNDTKKNKHAQITTKNLEKFFNNWGLRAVDLKEGKIEQLFTHMFIHGDWAHFLGNMIVLWAFVRTLEVALGEWTFAGMYLIWGVAAALAQFGVDMTSKRPMVGASGAIAGVIGAYFVAFGPRTKIKTDFILFLPPFVKRWRVNVPSMVFVGIWVILQLADLLEERETGHQGGVAIMAHLGGFMAGSLTMLAVGKNLKMKIIRTKEGELTLAEANQDGQAVASSASAKAALASGSQAAVPAPQSNRPTHCPYCGTAFVETASIASSLLQCPNSNCKRLTYVA